MTLIIKTESHGDIESGFFCNFTQMVRLGKYAFKTETLCNLVQYLAKNPDKKEIEISGYDVDKFWEIENKHRKNLAGLISDTSKFFVSQIVDIYIKENRGKLSEEDTQDLVKEGEIIPIDIDNNKKLITIGEYEIEDIHFGIMMYYITRGGWIGWPENTKPDYAEPTIKAIKKSRNPLFKKIQKEIR